MDPFAWKPAIGIDAAAAERIRAHFPRPAEPMGEAWFKGATRHMFEELMGDLSSLPASTLDKPLEEIASGISSFGPFEEWHDWYHYLLGQLLPRSSEDFVLGTLLGSLLTAFFALYPNGVHKEPYAGFRDDALATLGRGIMDPQRWDDEATHVPPLGDLGASMCFCMKYLPPARVPEWFASVLAIERPTWRLLVLIWLGGAIEMLHGQVRWPSEFKEPMHPATWWGSQCLRASLATEDRSGALPVDAFLPAEACACVLDLARQHLTDEVGDAWTRSIAMEPDAGTEGADVARMLLKALHRRPGDA